MYAGAMRIWDVAPRLLCQKHLTGEHRELHGLWNILTQGKHGYAMHPETRRWRGKLAALYARHAALAEEMARRGYAHASPLDPALAHGAAEQDQFVDPPPEQLRRLREKPCPCPLAAEDVPQSTVDAPPAEAESRAAPHA
ncbi:MAG TPA: pyrimidine dimer DNA glycosylase/endonuclease V [Dehalococcoidia bacterium]|nr:pyrimidine dimer DNA glycosylase/endonuclease V [Dehalococcoidia bacterium]